MLQFDLGVDFQKSLLRVLPTNDGFANHVMEHVVPDYFSNAYLAWVFTVMGDHYEQYKVVPSLSVVMHHVRKLPSEHQAMYSSVVQQIEAAPLGDIDWMRDKVVEFIRRQLFVRVFEKSRKLYNEGEAAQAYDLTMQAMLEIQSVGVLDRDRTFFFEDLAKRQVLRNGIDSYSEMIGTGLPWLDHILHGGLEKGELGVWIAYAKRGKTAVLCHLGKAASRQFKYVYHAVFEGNRKQIEDRYDAAFSSDAYSAVKSGDMDDDKYETIMFEYDYLRSRLVVEAFVDKWTYRVSDVWEGMQDLKRTKGWTPDAVIVDYGDLLTGSEGPYKNETDKQTAAFRELKTLSNRGFAVWTGSQARRPDPKHEEEEHLVKSANIADAYAKIRVADFIGSLNMTPEEFRNKRMRIYAELYRGNAADQFITVLADLDVMLFQQIEQTNPAAAPTQTLNQLVQTRIAV